MRAAEKSAEAIVAKRPVERREEPRAEEQRKRASLWTLASGREGLRNPAGAATTASHLPGCGQQTRRWSPACQARAQAKSALAERKEVAEGAQ